MKIWLVRYVDDPYMPWEVDSIFDSKEKAEHRLEEMLKIEETTPKGNKYRPYWPDDVRIEEWDVE